MTADSVLRAYLLERARRENPMSIQGVEPDMPRGTAPPSGRYEMLCGLVRQVTPEQMLAVSLVLFGYVLGGQWEVVPIPLESGRTLLTTEQRARSIPRRSIARKLGVTPAELTSRVNAAYAAVEDAIARIDDATRIEELRRG